MVKNREKQPKQKGGKNMLKQVERLFNSLLSPWKLKMSIGLAMDLMTDYPSKSSTCQTSQIITYAC